MCTSGRPQASVLLACSVTRLSARGSISAKPNNTICQGPGSRSSVLSSAPTPGTVERAIPVRALALALERPAARVFAATVFGHVGVARNVDARGTAAVVVAIEESGHVAHGADAVHVIHEIAADLVRAVRETVRKKFRFRVEQDLRGRDRRGAQEHHARLVAAPLLRLRIDDAHRGNAALGVIVVERLDDGVGDDASGFRCVPRPAASRSASRNIRRIRSRVHTRFAAGRARARARCARRWAR